MPPCTAALMETLTSFSLFLVARLLAEEILQLILSLRYEKVTWLNLVVWSRALASCNCHNDGHIGSIPHLDLRANST